MPAGLIKHCSRVLGWSRFSSPISRYPRSHDHVACPWSLVTAVNSRTLLPCRAFHSCKKGHAFGNQSSLRSRVVDRYGNALFFLFLGSSYFSTPHSFPSLVSVVALTADIIVLPLHCSLQCAYTALTRHSLSPRQTLFAFQSLPCG